MQKVKFRNIVTIWKQAIVDSST